MTRKTNMVRVRITKANEIHHLPVTNGAESADIPIDGKFHPIHPDLVGVLTDSNVGFDIANADATGGTAAAGGAAGLGDSAASPSKRRSSSKPSGKRSRGGKKAGAK